jgi:SM-20-related protein
MAYYSEESWLEWFDRLSEDDYVLIDNFLSPDLYKTIRSFFLDHLQMEDFSKAGIGSSGNRIIQSSIRGDYVYWLDRLRDTELTSFFELADELIYNLNRFCYLSLSGSEFHLAHYPAGTFYHRHLDQFKERNNRMISVIIYLNEQWKEEDAGQLKIFGEKDVLINPVANRCVLFRSNLVEHEVLLTHASRYSLTGWLLYQPPGLATLLS